MNQMVPDAFLYGGLRQSQQAVITSLFPELDTALLLKGGIRNNDRNCLFVRIQKILFVEGDLKETTKEKQI